MEDRQRACRINTAPIAEGMPKRFAYQDIRNAFANFTRYLRRKLSGLDDRHKNLEQLWQALPYENSFLFLPLFADP